MKKEAVKIYQSNTINLLMQFDTKYDKPYGNPFQREYCVGKAGNELYISVRPSQSYQELYRKKTGEYFLYGRGGAMTMYGECCGSNSWTGGSAILPLTVDEAQEWVMEHCDADTYISLFWEVEE